MRYFCDYMLQCIECVAQDNSSSSSVAQRHQKLGPPWYMINYRWQFLPRCLPVRSNVLWGLCWWEDEFQQILSTFLTESLMSVWEWLRGKPPGLHRYKLIMEVMKITRGKLPGLYDFTVRKHFTPLISVDPPRLCEEREVISPTVHIIRISLSTLSTRADCIWPNLKLDASSTPSPFQWEIQLH